MLLSTLELAQEPVLPSLHEPPRRPWLERIRRAAAWLLPVLVSACATYHPKPLPTRPDLRASPALTVPVSRLQIPGLKPHRFNPARGLDETDVVTLAVVDNPVLKAARLKVGVTGAELFSAGLLPDPQLSVGFDHPTSGPPPLFNAYNLGLSEDLKALVTRSATKAQARAHARQVNLQILWQEWQVAQKARELFIDANAQSQLRQVFTQARQLSAKHYGRDQAALKRGNVTLATVSADLIGLVDAKTRLRQLQRQANDTRHALNLLLGLRPGVQLRLTGGNDPAPLSRAQFEAAVAALAHRRIDLLALRAGYQSQEQALRKAILGQFPALNVGLIRASDTGRVRTVGIGISLSLPIFNRNRGAIAVQRATRAALYHAYQARLDEAVSEADRVWRATRIMAGQLQALQTRLSALGRTTTAAEHSFEQGYLGAGTYISLRSSLLAKRAEAIRLRASLAKARAALTTLLGMPLQAPIAVARRGGPS